jgi:hypothetical protein
MRRLADYYLNRALTWDERKPDVIQLPLLGLDGDHTDADAALG